jgi:hypothetical protein
MLTGIYRDLMGYMIFSAIEGAVRITGRPHILYVVEKTCNIYRL